ncbi:RNA-directed DNA polymerase, eukaryota [Tanacetum coccineum]
MTKQGNFTQRTPQAKKQSDQASRQISKQASGSANAPYDLVFTAMGPPLGTTQTTATITSTEGLQRATFTTPPQTVPGTNTTEPPPPPLRNKGPELGADNLTLEGVATELAPSDFVSQNYETLVALMQEETKKRSSQSLQARLNFGPEDEVSPPRHQKERRGKDNRRPPVFGRIGKKVSGTQTANLQNLDTHENNDWRISVRDRLGSRDVHSRLGQRRSPSESPPSSDSEDSRRKRRRRVSSSSEDSSDNEDAETGHWKSKNKYREDEDEDMSRPWRRQKVDAFTRRISDFSEDKKRRMPANVKTYDGTGDPDDHLKIFESAATIENWPQPVWCHMFNSTLVGNARNWFSKLPRRSIDGFEELRRAFRLNFTQRKKCAKNPVELARVKQRQGESTSAYVERYKDECIHVKACPEILKISGFMNGINNPELIKRLNDRVPQTFDELMKRTRSFIQGEAAAADSRKGYSNNRSQEQSRRQSNDQSSSRNNSYRGQRGGRGNDKYTPLTMTPKEILATEGANFPRPPPMRTPEEQRVGNGYCAVLRHFQNAISGGKELDRYIEAKIDKEAELLRKQQRRRLSAGSNGNGLIWLYRSKEDDVQKISTSVFITNFPDMLSANDLFNTCKQYGHVVDAFIPNKRMKAGKSMGWRFKLHANIAMFERKHLNNKNDQVKNKLGDIRSSSNDYNKDKGVKGDVNSYAHVVTGGIKSVNMESESNPTLVLDEECMNSTDLSNSLFGKVKEFAALSNLKTVLTNEGFDNIKIKYMGEFWVLLEFVSEASKKLFQSSVGAGSWFSQLIQASMDFTIDGKVAWVEIEGIPFKMWSVNTLKRIASKWGVLLRVDDQENDCFHTKRMFPGWVPDFTDENDEDYDTNGGTKEGNSQGEHAFIFGGESDIEEVPETKFEERLHGHNAEEVSMGQENKCSEDPFNLYDLLNKKKNDVAKGNNYEYSLKYPPGFTPTDDIEEHDKKDEESKQESGATKSVCSGHFKKSEIPRTRGSILNLMDELVKVGQTMGYNMEGPCPKGQKDWVKELCEKNKVNFLALQETKMKDIELFSVKMCWGNFAFDYVHSASVGVFGGKMVELESEVSKEEIKRAVWDCGTDKSPGPDGFTFAFYRRFWKVIEKDVVDVVTYFFTHGVFPKDFRHISLIGSLYKIIAKILANRLVVVLGSAFVADRQILDGPFILNEMFQWCKSKKKQSLVFKVDFEKACDSVRWDFLDDVLKKFGFGDKWCNWIQSCLRSSRGPIIVNGSPTEEFQFYKGLKQGDPLSPFLFILIMESLHISFQRVVDAGIDANFDIIVHVLECFFRASGMRLNISKGKLMGISVEDDKVELAASKISCLILKPPFSYLGSKVGGLMSRVQSWNEVIDRVNARLSKWKMKTLSIGGRLTLLKSVLGSMLIYHMSIFKALMSVLNRLESIRNKFLCGHDHNSRKTLWVKWKYMLASKEKGGLGVSSLYVLNRGLMFKWVWRFFTQKTSLWARFIKAIHGNDGKVGRNVKSDFPSVWLDIVIDVATKLAYSSLDSSFRRVLKGGVEQEQYKALVDQVHDVFLVPMTDRRIWSLEGSGDFSVASVRKLIDDKMFPEVATKTRWVKYVPIKVNVHAWKVRLDSLPTRFNIFRRGMDIDSITCSICDNGVESTTIYFSLVILLERFSVKFYVGGMLAIWKSPLTKIG